MEAAYFGYTHITHQRMSRPLEERCMPTSIDERDLDALKEDFKQISRELRREIRDRELDKSNKHTKKLSST